MTQCLTQRPTASRTRDRQRSLEEYTAPATSPRCKAVAEYTGERCRHDALPGLDYCAHHR